MSEKSPVAILRGEVARKIAAGEVIDRPSAVVRELMDNAVDSGADTITVEITGGGIDKIAVIDNGAGMTQKDLSLCATPHATSKIKTEQDLLRLSTLGFRGEALMSMAAVARLEIKSGGYLMQMSASQQRKITPCPTTKGTTVKVEGLFENFPARRVFLKRPSTEGNLCKQTFIEKALPRCDISFRLCIEGNIKYDFPKGVLQTTRFCNAVAPDTSKNLFYELKGTQADNWSFVLVIGEPGVFRADKKGLYIYVNGRRIQDYSLVQAIESGAKGFFPNGVHPVAALFAKIRADCVDFNIHPAKKEVRFKDISGLHHCVLTTVAKFFSGYAKKSSFSMYDNYNIYKKETSKPQNNFFDTKNILDMADMALQTKSQDNPFFETANMALPKTYLSPIQSPIQSPIYPLIQKDYQNSTQYDTQQSTQENDFRYIGQVLGTFLIVQKNDAVYFIDQHAAHERIRYNKIMQTAQKDTQNLLVPYIINTQNSTQDDYLKSIQKDLAQGGYNLQDCGAGLWQITSVPSFWQGSQAQLQADLLEKRLTAKDTIKNLAASAACRGAVKDGDVLDATFAANLAKKALELDDPHCPHGRPIWTVITKQSLFSLVKRT